MPRAKSLRFSHYTHLSSVLGVFGDGEFRFSSIGKSNDFQEQALLASLKRDGIDLEPYACSFCLLKHYIPMWWIYSKRKENDDFGMMVYFILKEGMKYEDFFEDEKVVAKKATYVPVRRFNRLIKDPSSLGEGEIGFVKSNYWKYEKEIRFALFNPQRSEEDDFVARKINFDSIAKIEFYLAPDVEPGEIEGVKRKLEGCKCLKGMNLHVQTSAIGRVFDYKKGDKGNDKKKE